MQQTNYKSYKFLRGRQITDYKGKVKLQVLSQVGTECRATHISCAHLQCKWSFE